MVQTEFSLSMTTATSYVSHTNTCLPCQKFTTMNKQVSAALTVFVIGYFYFSWHKFQEPHEYQQRVLLLVGISIVIQFATSLILSLSTRYLRLLVISSIMTSAVGFLFGATIDTNLIVWGCLVSVLNIIPNFDLTTYAYSEFDLFVSLACVWASAFVIPLDWDRPWQVWPVCCTYGAAAGNVLGTITRIFNRNNSAPILTKVKKN